MHFRLGNLHMNGGDYECAIQSFQCAQLKLGDRTDEPPLIVSLVCSLLPRNIPKFIPIPDRFRGGTLIVLQSQFNNECVRPSFQQVAPRRLASLYYAW